MGYNMPNKVTLAWCAWCVCIYIFQLARLLTHLQIPPFQKTIFVNPYPILLVKIFKLLHF